MKVQIAHNKGREEAKKRLGTLVHELKSKYSGQIDEITEVWDGYVDTISGKAKGFSVSGLVDVKESIVTVDLTVPFLLRGFSKKIKGLIEEKVQEVLL